MNFPKKNILGISIQNLKKKDILDKIKYYISNKAEFCHVVSLNPEILVMAQNNVLFKKVLQTAQIRIIDGVGVVVAGRLLGVNVGDRLTGVDLMEELLSVANQNSLSVGLIGGGEKIAEKLIKCQKDKYPKVNIFGMQGIKDIYSPKYEEENQLFSIVADRKPHILFVSFGSPAQELWIYKNRSKLNGIVCIGVGGAFDYLSNNIVRAPKIIRSLGLEWMFRLIRQPWRVKRQTRLIEFVLLVLKEKFLTGK